MPMSAESEVTVQTNTYGLEMPRRSIRSRFRIKQFRSEEEEMPGALPESFDFEHGRPPVEEECAAPAPPPEPPAQRDEPLPAPPEAESDIVAKPDIVAKSDIVDMSVFAPDSVRAGAQCLVQVFLHTLEAAAEAQARAQEADAKAKRKGVKTLATEVARGTRVEVIFDPNG